MGGKIGIVEELNRISEDWAKNFARSWTIKELEESVTSFNKSDDINLRTKLFIRFLSTRHILYVHIETIGVFKTEQPNLNRFFPSVVMGGDDNIKVGVQAKSIVVLRKKFERTGCRCTIPHPIWVPARKFFLSGVKKIKKGGNTLLITLA